MLYVRDCATIFFKVKFPTDEKLDEICLKRARLQDKICFKLSSVSNRQKLLIGFTEASFHNVEGLQRCVLDS